MEQHGNGSKTKTMKTILSNLKNSVQKSQKVKIDKII